MNGKIIGKYIEKWTKMSPAAKASIALVIAKFFQKGMSMISGPIFTRIMPQGEYGIVSTFTSWQSVLYIIATLNMAQGVFNNGMLNFKNDRDSFTFSILCLANACTTFIFVIYLLFFHWFNALFDMSPILVVIMFLYFIFTPAYNYWMGRQRFEFKYKATTFIMIGISVFSTLLAILFVVVTPDESKAIAKIIGTESVFIAIGFVFYIYIIIKSKMKFNIRYWKYALSFNLPLIPHYLSMYVLSSSDRIVISKLVSTSATAIYNVAYTVASIMLIFWNAVDASYAPWIYQHLEIKDYAGIKKRGNQILLFFLVASILANLFAPEVIRALAPENYYSGIYVIPSVSAGVFFTAIYSLFMRIELYEKKTKLVMVGTVFAAVFNLILNYIFIPVYGFYAAGYTTLMCYILLSIFHYINVYRIGYKNIYDIRKIINMSILVLISCVIMSLLYDYTIIRYGLIIVLLVIIVCKRSFFINVLKGK